MYPVLKASRPRRKAVSYITYPGLVDVYYVYNETKINVKLFKWSENVFPA